MRCRAYGALILAGLLAFGTAVSADEAGAPIAAAEAQEQNARREIQVLRGAAGSLKRLAVEIGKDGAGGEATASYVKWLESASLRVGSLGKRWTSSLNYYYRDFPRDALLADPERLAYAIEWLGDLNAELAAEAAGLQEKLEARNETFVSEVAGSHVESARSILAGLGASAGSH